MYPAGEYSSPKMCQSKSRGVKSYDYRKIDVVLPRLSDVYMNIKFATVNIDIFALLLSLRCLHFQHQIFKSKHATVFVLSALV